MSEKPFEPSTVTKPIQLLAAWLIGLILINTSFLGGAVAVHTPSWAPALLVIAAVANVPLFLFCLFMLQTKFRPEMQEDSFYNKYLERRYSEQTQKIEIVSVEGSENDGVMPRKSENITIVNTKNSIVISDYKIRANDLLENFQEIVNRLGQVGLKVDSTFGSTSEKKGRPEKFGLSVGSNSHIEVFQKVLSILLDFGLEYVAFAPESYSKGGIYIGSYIHEVDISVIKNVNRDLITDLMKEGLHEMELRRLLRV